MNKCCNYLVEQLICNHVIRCEDREIYLYGFRKILISGLNYFFFLLVGALLQVLFYALLFLLLFVPLRIFGGGVHAKSEKRCFLYSSIMAYLVLTSIKYYFGNFIDMILIINSALIIYLYPYIPVNCTNDRRRKEEKLYFKKVFCGLVLVENILTILMILLNQTIFAYMIQVAILVENILLLFGRINQLKAFKITR